jgi:hypothetical protein
MKPLLRLSAGCLLVVIGAAMMSTPPADACMLCGASAGQLTCVLLTQDGPSQCNISCSAGTGTCDCSTSGWCEYVCVGTGCGEEGGGGPPFPDKA